MTRLDQLPELQIISGLKGTIDFYYWKGTPVARRWPRKSTYTPSPQEQASRSQFAQDIPALGAMPPLAVYGIPATLLNNGWTWRDAWMVSIWGKNQTWP